MAEEVFGPYRVSALLGRGGMGEVHEAYDTTRERVVALKRFAAADPDPALKERFRRESRIAARLDSPHVVPIHDFGVIDDRLYIDMRLVRGGDLGTLLAADGPLDPDRAVAVVGQLADALDSAHAAGLVHRDVKPSNALVAVQGGKDFTYLTDFGNVHVTNPPNAERLTVTGNFLGTPAYMAPEQLLEMPFDRRLDVYALGCLLVAVLTGRPPFTGDRLHVMYQHLHAPPPAPSRRRSGLPAGIDAVIAAALAKEPDDRPATAGALADAARQALALPSLAPPGARAIASSDDPPGTAAAGSSGRAETSVPPPSTAAPRLGQDGSPPARRLRPGLVAVVLGVLVVVAVVIGFGLAVGGAPSVSATAVEAQIVTQTGLRPEQVTCPGDLPAEVGESIFCEASAGGSRQGLRVTVTSVQRDQVDFDITPE